MAFELLKWHVSQAPVLVHADPNAQFCLETDALNYAYSAILSQKQTDGHHHLISFMSKSMNLAEQNYSGISPTGQYHPPGNSVHAMPNPLFFLFTYVNRIIIHFETLI